MTALTVDRFPTLAAVRTAAAHDGHFLGRHAGQPADGCRACGIPRRDHGQRWAPGGFHAWIEPGTWLRKVRILARRELAAEIARDRAEHDALIAEFASWVAMEESAPKLPAGEVGEGYEVLVHGEWRAVSGVDHDEAGTPPLVWLHLGAGYSIGRPANEPVPARKIGERP